ncbi:MAG: hypothetical protein QW738_08840 [Nitrososphaeria archaeon]
MMGNCGVFLSETEAVGRIFKDKEFVIQKLSTSHIPRLVIKP